MIACGATAVGVCTALIVKGPEIITEVNEQMAQFMRQHKIESLTALQGDALSRIDFPASIEERREYEKQRVELPDRVALIDQSLCTRCQTCYRVCPHKAVERRGEAFFVHPSLCQGCGLCISMCLVGAIRYAQESDKGR